jgi:hypothetical protein
MPTQATYEDANLILRLYELRREETMREARQWFAANYHAGTMEEANRLTPPGSKENAYARMVGSYWEMVASFITSGVLNQDLFFQSGGELVYVWERIRKLVPAMREASKNPAAYRSLEIVGNAYIKYLESLGPEAYAAFQARVGPQPKK